MIYGVHGLASAAARLNNEHGLSFLAGGRHPGGTRNAVARLKPTQYLELIVAEDPKGDGGRMVIQEMAGEERLIGWAIEVDDITATAARVNREIVGGSIKREDGSVGSWRVVHRDESWFPFFIEYEGGHAPRAARWRSEGAGNEAFGGFAWIELVADEREMRGWLGDLVVPIRYARGEPGLRAVAIEGPDGEIVIR